MSGRCRRAGVVFRDADPGRDPDLAAHLATCPECARTRALHRALVGEGERLRAGADLPEAHEILARARLEGRPLATDRVLRPIRLAWWTAGAVGAGSAVPLLADRAGQWRALLPGDLGPLATGQGVPEIGLAGLATLLLASLVVALLTAWEAA